MSRFLWMGLADCFTNRMHQLIDGLRGLGVEFPEIQARGLSGDDYTGFTVPWNSFSDKNQGFSVDLDPKLMFNNPSRKQGLPQKAEVF
jgi:hypothetical protein